MLDHGTPSGPAGSKSRSQPDTRPPPEALIIPDLAGKLGRQDAVARAVAALVSGGLLAGARAMQSA
jgi:hypothetical protein